MPMLTKKAWYGPSSVGSLLPFPQSWEGWAAFLVFIILIAATALLGRDLGNAARVALCVVYLALCYATYDKGV